MGRRDAVQTILEVVAECRRLLPGLIVTWEPGWETRGNGTSANYSFASIHHTASASSAAKPFPTQRLLVTGRPDLTGPLCNVATPWSTMEMPRLHIVAAHPANHGGASRASGPIPALSLFNPTSIGNEIDYAGTAPMSAGQLLVGHVFTRAVANVLGGGNVEVVRGHYETSVTGKWDPGFASGKSYDMNDWRRQSAAIGAPVAPPAPAQMEDDEMDAWNAAVLAETLDRVKGITFPKPGVADAPSKYMPRDSLRLESVAAAMPALLSEVAGLRASQQELVAAIGKLAAGQDIDVDDLVKRIEGVVDSAVADAAKLVTVKVSVEDDPTT